MWEERHGDINHEARGSDNNLDSEKLHFRAWDRMKPWRGSEELDANRLGKTCLFFLEFVPNSGLEQHISISYEPIFSCLGTIAELDTEK